MRVICLAVAVIALLTVACAEDPPHQAPLDTTPLRYQQDRPPSRVSTPVPTIMATATPAPTPTPRWTASTVTPDARTARQWVDEFVLCTSNPYSPDYARVFVEDPMPALDRMIENGALGPVLWNYFVEQANPERFNSILYIDCIYDVELVEGAGHDLGIVAKGYEEIVCNQMDWLGRDGYDVLKGYILEIFYNTMVESSC